MRLEKTTYNLFYLLLLSPVIAYVIFGVLNMRPIQFYFQVFIIVYGIYFLLLKNKQIKIPLYLVYALLWAVYLFVWTFFNGDFERRGLLASIINNPPLAIFFILLIINNTSFGDAFISKAITIFKLTVVATAVVSIMQVLDGSFLNAGHLWAQDDLKAWAVGDIYTMRRASIFGYIEPNALGLSFIPLLALLVGYLIYTKSKASVFFLVAGALPAFLSNTRYIMIGFLILTFQMVSFTRVRFMDAVRYTIVISIVLVLSFQAIKFLGYDIQDWSEERLFREGSIKETTRFKAIDNFVYFFPKFVFLGNGSIMDEDVVAASQAFGSSHIHMGYLSHLVAYGIIGCFFLFTFWFLVLKRFLRNARKTNYWSSFYAFLIFLVSFATMSQSSIFYYGLLFAFIFDKYYIDKYWKNKIAIAQSQQKAKVIRYTLP